LKGKRAAVVLYSFYPADPRPRREAEAVARAGMQVDLVCLRQKPEEPTRETINGVNVLRVPIPRRRDSKLTYLLQYSSFLAFSTVLLAFRSWRKRYDLVHVHNMPDVLVFSALVPRLRGARVVLDLHDPMPELMMTIFGIGEESRTIKLLKHVEKRCIAFADRVLTVNLACKKIFASRSCRPEKIEVVMNAPDEQIFSLLKPNGPAPRNPSLPFVIMYHGSIVERHGLDLAVRALGIVRKTVPEAELRVYGSRTPFLDRVMNSVANNGVRDSVHYLGPKSLEEIVKAIEESDVGVIPNRRSIFTEINTPTRIFEYLSRAKPVIAPMVPGITDYFDQDDLVFFQLGDVDDLARKIIFVHSHSRETQEIINRGQKVYLDHNWSREKLKFLNVVGDLLAARALIPNRSPSLRRPLR
jgi:glycosyltransferase involved in cell wall biosynthesis